MTLRCLLAQTPEMSLAYRLVAYKPGVDKGTVNCELGKFWCELVKLETVKNCENHVNCEIGFTVTVKWK